LLEFHVVTLFPGFFESPLRQAALARAQRRGVIAVHLVNPRQHAVDKHHTVDDYPYGGGRGMLMKPEPLIAAIGEVCRTSENCRVVLLSPQGEIFSQALAEEMANLTSIGLVCGRYEGVDERVREFVDQELSIGDFVVSGGECAALVVMEAVTRLLPGGVGNSRSIQDESFSDGLLEYPQYTRPRSCLGKEIPPVLLSGNHEAIRVWRRRQQLLRTMERRPELLTRARLTPEDREFLRQVRESREASS
jgi:tRNA (guanine37-N1)-methyltransferase